MNMNNSEMDETKRLVCSAQIPDDESETGLRPKKLSEFVGQKRICDNLTVFLTAAKHRSEPLDHVLLYGPPGLGKTTLAYIIANEMEANIRITSGPAIERPGDLAAILTNLEPGSVLLIDEIHRLPRTVEEILYPAMEDFQLDLIIGKGPSARSLRLDLPKFTVVGATTRAGLLTSPLRDRFGIIHNFGFYEPDEMFSIVNRSASILNIPIEPTAATEIGNRSRGTPRIANRLLRRVRDFADVKSDGTISNKVAQNALNDLEVDSLGLDGADRNILKLIIEKFSGGPVGIETIAAAINEDSGTIEDVIEPFLIKLGFLQRTPRGRSATLSAYEHLGVKPPKSMGPALFD